MSVKGPGISSSCYHIWSGEFMYITPEKLALYGRLHSHLTIDLRSVRADNPLLLSLLGIERHIQTQALASGVGSDASLRISLCDELFAASINE